MILIVMYHSHLAIRRETNEEEKQQIYRLKKDEHLHHATIIAGVLFVSFGCFTNISTGYTSVVHT